MNQFNPSKTNSLLNSKSKPVVPSTSPLGVPFNADYPKARRKEPDSVLNEWGKATPDSIAAMNYSLKKPETLTSSYEKMLGTLSPQQRSELNERRATRLSDLQMEYDLQELLKQKAIDEERARSLALYPGLK